MLQINTDASSKNESPRYLIGYIILQDNVVLKKDVREINIGKIKDDKKVNETIYLELLSVNFALGQLMKSNLQDIDGIEIYNDNTTVIYILNRLFRNKRKTTKIEEILQAELENAKDIISRIGTVKFKYINSKDNKAHKTLENYRKAYQIYVVTKMGRRY